MSIFRVEIDLSFSTEDQVIAFANLVEGIKPEVFKGTGLEPISIIRNLRYHECFHDEDPPKQCGDYKNIDFDGVKVEHKKEDGSTVDTGIIVK